jgi:hypothetical protein
MVDSRYITITVQYDREPKYGRSLEWIAPELKGSALTMTEDHLDDPRPSRTWAGVVDGPTYEQVAKAWRLPREVGEPNARTRGDSRELATHTYTLDGMNWETGNRSPIVYVSLQVTAPAPPQRQRRARPKPPIGPRP